MSYVPVPDSLSEIVHWRDASKVDLQTLDVLTTISDVPLYVALLPRFADYAAEQRQLDTARTGVINLSYDRDPDTATAVFSTLIEHNDLDGLASLSHRDSAVRLGVAQNSTDKQIHWVGHYLLLTHWVLFTGIGAAWRTMMGILFMLLGANFESADVFLAETFDRAYDTAAFTLFCTAVLLRRGKDLDPVTRLYNTMDHDTLDRWGTPGNYNPLLSVSPDGTIPSSHLPLREDIAAVTVYLYWVLLYKGTDVWSLESGPQRTSVLLAAINDVRALRLAGISRDELCDAILSAMSPKPAKTDLRARGTSLTKLLVEAAIPVGISLVDLRNAAAIADRVRQDFPSLPWASWNAIPHESAMNLVREVVILGDLYNFQSTGNADVLDLLAREVRNGRSDAVHMLLAFELDTRQARRDIVEALALEARASAFPSTPSTSHRGDPASVPATPSSTVGGGPVGGDPPTAFTPRSEFGLRQLTDNLRVITASQAPTLTPVATPTSGVAASIHSPYRAAATATAASTPSALSAALEGDLPSPIVSRVPTPTGFSVPSPLDASMIPLPPSRMPSLEPMGPPPVPTRADPPLPR